MGRRARATVLAWALGLAACTSQAQDEASGANQKKGGDQAGDLSPERLTQGMELCLGYVGRVCACAGKDSAFQEECSLARGRPEALKLVIKVLAGSQGPISTTERKEQEAGAKKIIAACVRADAALDPSRCGR
jgi:hypothetical protein